MPYKIKGKCIFRKDTGKKVGCTKGSVKKYLGALHANVKESTEKNILETLFENLTVNTSGNIDIPEVLYHATYKPLIKQILQNGLGGNTRKNYEDSVSGIVYLAYDQYQAESYAETSDMVPESWLDNIIILQINTIGLDKSLFAIDRNNQAGDTLEYQGIIPIGNIKVIHR